MLPKISVITVCYNVVQSIERTIQSVKEQDYPDIEYVVIDGGSTDGTVETIRKYADCIACWVSEPDKGIYDAMNKGILRATGDYLIFMNAGDTFATPHIISEMMLAGNGEGVIYGNILRCFHVLRRKGVGITAPMPRLIDFVDNTFHHQGAFIRRELFTKYGLYATRFRLMADWEFFFRSVYQHKEAVKYVDKVVAHFRMDGVSTRRTEEYLKERRDFLVSLYGEEMYGYVSELLKYRNCLVARCALRTKGWFTENGAFRKAKQYLRNKL